MIRQFLGVFFFLFFAPVRKVSLSTWFVTRRRGDGGNTDRVEGEDLGCLWGRPSAVARWGFIPLVFSSVFLETPLGFCQCGEWIRKDVESQGWDLMMGLGLVDVDEFRLIWGWKLGLGGKRLGFGFQRRGLVQIRVVALICESVVANLGIRDFIWKLGFGRVDLGWRSVVVKIAKIVWVDKGLWMNRDRFGKALERSVRVLGLIRWMRWVLSGFMLVITS